MIAEIDKFIKIVELDEDLDKTGKVIVHTFVYKAQNKQEEKLIKEGNLPAKLGLMKSFFEVKRIFPNFSLYGRPFHWDYENKTITFEIHERIK